MFGRQVFLGLALAGTAVPTAAQEIEKPKVEASAAEVAGLIAQLGADSFKDRLAAERELRGLGDHALDALRQAAEKSEDPEVRWRAQRLVRQIESGDGGALRGRQRDPMSGTPPEIERRPPGTGQDLDGVFDRLFRQLERDFDLDIPKRRFFQDDFFRDLDAQMQDMRRRMDEAMKGGGVGQQGRGMSMQVTPDGVRVEVEIENEAGEKEKKVYEAPDLQTFREKYPGVLEGQGLGLRLRFAEPDLFGRRGFLPTPFPPRQPDWRPPTMPAPLDAPPPPPPGKRLGVLVREEIDPSVREFLGLDEGVGLQVQEVQDGLGARLGLRPGDIVLKIGDREIGGVADVAEALGAIDAGETVEVVVNSRGHERTLKAQKQDGAEKREKGTLRGRGDGEKIR